MKKLFFITLCISLCTIQHSLYGQEAGISTFSFMIRDSKWDGTKEYVVWKEDISNRFTFINTKKQAQEVRTVDTLLSYAEQAISQKLGVKIQKKTVDDAIMQASLGDITGFPAERLKSVVKKNIFEKIVEVNVTATPEQAAAVQVGSFNKGYQVVMEVLVKVYDRTGNLIGKYKQSSKLTEPKKIKSRLGNPLTGNELFELFASTLDMTLKSN